MTALTHWIDAFINIMLGLCIGVGLTLAFVLGCWLVARVLRSIIGMGGNLTLDPKKVYPSYVTKDIESPPPPRKGGPS